MNHRILSLLAAAAGLVSSAFAAAPANPILYVTQVPIPDEVLTHDITQTKMSIASTMQSPLAEPAHAGRGGALWIRYANGTPRNLTAAAGLGGAMDANFNATGFQGANSIAVHHPYMHWSGSKAIFAMIVGAPTSANDATVFHWQLYEITNFAQGQTPVITLVSGQPPNYNNFEACYDTQDRIIFVSDAPRGLQANLYPQLDEYMDEATNTGLWRLDRANANELKQIIHAPSGAFTPFLDSGGRVLFVQWDHFTRDVSATYDRIPDGNVGETWTQTHNGNGTFDSEAPGANFTLGTTGNYSTFNNYPEPRNFDKTELLASGTLPDGITPNINGNAINQFFPWECREDGSSHEVINHVGRHEFGGSNLGKNRNDDPNLVAPTFTNPTALNMLHLIESPTSLGTYYAVNPPELGTHMAGPIFRFNGAAGTNPDTMTITYVTPNVFVPNPALGQAPLANAVDIYRTPLPLSDGKLLAVHSAVKQYDSNNGADAQHPKSRYDFKLRMLMASGANMVPDLATTLVTEPNVNFSYYANGTLITYNGAPLWELDPVEVVTPTKPAQLGTPIASVEQTVFDEELVHAPTFQNYLRTHNLALVVNRNSTHRDAADRQQPFNLKVAWSATQTIGASGKIYDIGWLRILQADAIRGYTLSSLPNALPQPGRRNLPIPLHDTLSEMPVTPGAPSGAVKLGDDGSWAAILPAGRAVTWDLLDGAGTKSQVKERYWVTFAPGEVRTCAVCHGVNTKDQANNLGVPTNKPEALRTLLQFWRGNHPPGSMQHSAASASALKNAGTATLSVTRTGGSTGPVSVNFSTTAGSAHAGTDYTTTNGTLSWPDGDTAPKTITVPLLNNPVIAASKTLSVTLSTPTYGSLGAQTTNTLTLTEPPFQAWQFANFGANANTAATAGDLADPDGDGLANVIEYAFGANPNAASPAALPVVASEVVASTHYVTLTYTRDTTRTDITYQPQVSTDLANWSNIGDAIVGTNGNLETRKASAPQSGGQKFLRVKVTRN